MYTAAELAERSGVDTAYIERLVELGILHADGEGSASFRPTDPRRVRMVRALDEGGVPLEGLGEAFRLGALSLDFVEQASYERFSAGAEENFEQLAARTGIPLDLALSVREATGSSRPEPSDRVREGELEILAMIETLVVHDVRPAVVAQTLRPTATASDASPISRALCGGPTSLVRWSRPGPASRRPERRRRNGRTPWRSRPTARSSLSSTVIRRPPGCGTSSRASS